MKEEIHVKPTHRLKHSSRESTKHGPPSGPGPSKYGPGPLTPYHGPGRVHGPPIFTNAKNSLVIKDYECILRL